MEHRTLSLGQATEVGRRKLGANPRSLWIFSVGKDEYEYEDAYEESDNGDGNYPFSITIK